jgi:hypothetical protein
MEAFGFFFLRRMNRYPFSSTTVNGKGFGKLRTTTRIRYTCIWQTEYGGLFVYLHVVTNRYSF